MLYPMLMVSPRPPVYGLSTGRSVDGRHTRPAQGRASARRLCARRASACARARQGSADRALDRLDEPLDDWARVRPQCGVPAWVRALQRCGPLRLLSPHTHCYAESPITRAHTCCLMK
jgi:hypothetical protein